jgi:hypothetical protein
VELTGKKLTLFSQQLTASVAMTSEVKKLPATFLGVQDVFFLHAAAEPEPVKSDG